MPAKVHLSYKKKYEEKNRAKITLMKIAYLSAIETCLKIFKKTYPRDRLKNTKSSWALSGTALI